MINRGAERSRSFGGCVTCRTRHSKCDETHPTCANCQVSGLKCGGYEKNIFFDFENTADRGSSRFRRPLFTEHERKCMSESLVAIVHPGAVLHDIFDIDSLCEDASTSLDIDIARGPFGAFRFRLGNSEGAIDTLSRETSDGEQPLARQATDDDCVLLKDSDLQFAPGDQHLIEASLLRSDVIELSNLPNGMQDLHRMRDGFNEVVGNEMQQFYTSLVDSTMADDLCIPYNIFTEISTSSTRPIDISIVPGTKRNVPEDAVFLLNHYSMKVLPLLTVFRHSKTPWHILFIPHIKNCLAALALGDTIDHASLSAFYGILSISAFSLGGISNSPIWLEQAAIYHVQARTYANLMLETAYRPSKLAKYKSILMALLTMVQISIVSGYHDQKDYYLLEAERFIRVKGLNRTKSRKVRLLHHCYAFERILHETLFASGRNTAQRVHIRRTIEVSGAVRYSADALTFRVGKWSDLELDMLRIKGCEESENDLHLQIPGQWSKTMYPEIFGVPESYLLLLSMIIRLQHEKDRAKSGEPDCISLKDYTVRAKSLENCIKHVSKSDVSELQSQVPVHILDSLLESMQHALSICFYRRIHDLDAALLQTKVRAIWQCLQKFESAVSDEAYGSLRLVWPAYVAACEAEDIELQASLSQWFELMAKRTGLQLFREASIQAELHRIDKSCLQARAEPALPSFLPPQDFEFSQN